MQARSRRAMPFGSHGEHKNKQSQELGLGVLFADRLCRGGVASVSPAKQFVKCPTGLRGCGTNISLLDDAASVSEYFFEPFPQLRSARHQIHRSPGKQLRVMKFGGTSVGDASCIEKVVQIIRAASQESSVVVVVSAMSSVTNQLIEAATQSEAGNRKHVATILDRLRKQHSKVVSDLIHSDAERTRIRHKLRKLFGEAERLCNHVILRRELTPCARDAILGLGERLSAPLVATSLAACGVASEAIEATELVVTDSYHGAAEPQMDMTRRLCEVRLHPLVQNCVVPVITGFIGATSEGVPTTLGRGSSDYSATILSAALDADEVIIWTDVDGVLTADPRLVPRARTIPETSYHEAAELAYFGAKVLHPKTLHPVVQSGIPVWIRNTFAPSRAGTKITAEGSPGARGGARALTGMSNVAMITVNAGALKMPSVLGRILTVAKDYVLLISESPLRTKSHLAVLSEFAERTVAALRLEFAWELSRETIAPITLNPAVAIVTVVGLGLRETSEIIERMLDALDRESISIMAIMPGSSGCNISFAVEQKDLQKALVTAHREFQLDAFP